MLGVDERQAEDQDVHDQVADADSDEQDGGVAANM